MAAGAGYIEFTTGDILTASAANEYLASQVVMVFASASARTSAIASPQEGMMSYLKDTNSTEYYSGSAWVAIGGSASGFTLITSGSFTASSAVNINDCFSSTYNQYKIIVKYTNADSGTRDARLRLRVSGSDASGADYSYGSDGARDNGADFTTSGANQNQFDFGRANSSNANYSSFEIITPFQAVPTVIYGAYAGHDGSTAFYNTLGGRHGLSTSYTGCSIIALTGNLSGNYYVYGMAN